MSQAEPARPNSSQKTLTKRDPGLHQPTGRQRRLAEQRQAVGFAQGGRLAAQVEGVSHLVGVDQFIRQVAEAVASAAGVAGVEVAAPLVDLRGQGAAGVEPVEGEVGVGVGGAGDLEAPVGGYADVRLRHVELLLLQRLDDVSGGLAAELGPDGVVGAAEEGGVGAGAGHFADATAAEREGQGDVGRHGPRATAAEVIDHRADEGHVPAVVRVQLHRHVDPRHAGQGISDSVDRIWVR